MRDIRNIEWEIENRDFNNFNSDERNAITDAMINMGSNCF